MRISRSMAAYVLTMCLLPALAWSAPAPQADSERERALFALNRLGFGPSGDDVDRVAQMGVSTYIEQQLHPERIPLPKQLQQQLAALPALNENSLQLYAIFKAVQQARKENKNADDPAVKRQINAQLEEPALQARQAKLLRAIESPRQLEEALVDFWYNHFNVYAGKEIDHVFVGDYEEHSIRPYVFGHFRDMLGATAKSAAMLYYLDQWKDVAPEDQGPKLKPNGQPVKNDAEGINENYAREVMELHTLGVNGGYTQGDVTQLAHILTGWGYGGPKLPQPQRGRKLPFSQPTDAQKDEIDTRNHAAFYFNPDKHDNGTKSFLGRTFTAAGQAEGEAALDMLAYSPVTAHHVSYELAQYFVADNPPEALVRRMAATWMRTSGDLREVTRTMIESSEFWDHQYREAKYRTPFQYVTAAIRASGVPVDTDVLLQQLKQMGELPYDCLTPDGYKSTSDAWLNPSATEVRLSFATALGSGKLQQIHMVQKPDGSKDRQDDKSPPVPLDAQRIEATLANDFSPQTAQALAAVADPTMQAAAVLGSPEMMRR
jgi:uncharacterized protein (DUF1800 family)